MSSYRHQSPVVPLLEEGRSCSPLIRSGESYAIRILLLASSIVFLGWFRGCRAGFFGRFPGVPFLGEVQIAESIYSRPVHLAPTALLSGIP